MPYATVNGINLYYETHGYGQPLLMIMGLGSDCRHYSLQLQEFSKNYQVIIFDNRGVGRSDAPDGEYTISMMAKDALELINFLNICNAHILGFSLGGYIAQQIAIDSPQHVKSLILANTALYSYPRSKHIQDAFAAALKQGMPHVHHISLLMPWLFSANFFSHPERVSFFIQMANAYSNAAQPLSGYLGQVAAANTHNSCGKLGKLNMPVLLLAASDDLIAPPSRLEEIKQEITHAELVVLKDVGHCCYIENPTAFNKAVLHFLNRVSKLNIACE